MRRSRGTLLTTVETGFVALQGSRAYVDAMRRRLEAVVVISEAKPMRPICNPDGSAGAQFAQTIEVSLGPKTVEGRHGHR